MIPDLEILKPGSLDELLDILYSRGPDGAMLIAGGTDLVVRMKDGNLQPNTLIALDKIEGLDEITEKDGYISIGACTTHTQIMESALLREKAPILPLACAEIGSPQIRNRGTLGGNIGNASPCADTFGPLAVLEAKVILRSKNEERCLDFLNCFKGPKETTFRKNEMITAILFKAPVQPKACFYLAQGQRKAMAVTKLSVAGQLVFSEDGCISSARIAYGAVAPTIIRGEAVEGMITGKALSGELVGEMASLAAREVKPITDIRSTKEYRAEIIGVLLKRGLESLMPKNEEPE